jgi:hypothetical protein
MAKAVRRGNTAGLVGLWNSRTGEDNTLGTANSAIQDNDSLRRVSFKMPARKDGDFLSAAAAESRYRKVSEIVRPHYKTSFAAEVLKERREDPLPEESVPTPPVSAAAAAAPRRGSLGRSKSVKCPRIKFDAMRIETLHEEGKPFFSA